MGLLAGIEDGTGFDMRECESFVGTSAGRDRGRAPGRGAVPAATVGGRHRARGAASRRPVAGSRSAALAAARRAGSFALAASSTFAPLALGVAAPGGAVLRALLLRGTAAAARDARSPAAPGRASRRLGSTGACASPPSTAHPGAGSCSAARAPRCDGRGGGRGVVHRPVAVRAGARSAGASTSTAASGARPTSTPRPRAATHTCCA